MNLETDVSEPLYIQIANIIRQEIVSEVLKPGQKIPTENELRHTYKVSRITIRNALKVLQKEYLLTRKRGKGTYVSIRKMAKSVTGVLSFSDICRMNGFQPRAKTIKCVLEDANSEDIDVLRLAPESKMVVIERIRYADNVPVSFEISRFTFERFQYLLDEDLNDVSLFELIKEKHDVSFSSSTKVIEVQYASYLLATYLRIPRNYPLLSISSVTLDAFGTPTHRTHQYIDSDKFKLIV